MNPITEKYMETVKDWTGLFVDEDNGVTVVAKERNLKGKIPLGLQQFNQG